MTVYTYSHARQNFSDVLLRARQDGEVLIKRQDGSLFSLKRAALKKSLLDVPGIKVKITRDIIDALKDARAR